MKMQSTGIGGFLAVLWTGSLLAAPAPFEIQTPVFPTVVFPSEEVTVAFKANEGTRLEITSKNYLSEAKHSLRFTWTEPCASFTWKNAEAFTHLSGADPDPLAYKYTTITTLSTFSLWVFNEKPIKDRLWFEIGAEQRSDARFYMNLDFAGWRPIQAIYGRDIRSMPQPGADTLRVIAPKTVAQGTLLFDKLDPRIEMDVRKVVRTPEAPWVNNIAAAYAGGGLCTNPAIARMDAVPRVEIPIPTELDMEQRAAMRALTDQFMAAHNSPVKIRTLSAQEMETLRARYAKHQIARDGRWVSGQILSAQDLWGTTSALVEAWTATADQSEPRAELREMTLDLFDLAVQRGFPVWYGVNAGFVRPVYLFRSELERTGRFTLLIERFKELYGVSHFDEADLRGNADEYLTMLHGQLGAILLQADGPQKWRDLKALQRYLDFTSMHGEMLADGSFFHHGKTYSYGIPALVALGNVLHLLHGTPFFPEQMHQAARRCAVAMRFYSCGVDMPHFVGGRWRENCRLSPSVFKDLAECGNPVDREMAGYYLWYGQNDDASLKYYKIGIQPIAPTGHLTLPNSVAAFHRRGDWMSVVHGQKKYFNAAESYACDAGNTMGRYLAFGQTFIHSKREAPGKPVTAKASGYEGMNILNNGWDFNHWPGTTARALPFDALRSHFSVEEQMTAEVYAGGTDLDGNGLFAMKLQEDLPGLVNPLRIGPPRWWLGDEEYQRRVVDSCYDPAFRARKSWFFFGDYIVCLGSGITCADTRFPIHTTLFQNVLNLPVKHDKFLGAGEKVFPLDMTLADAAQPRWLMDSSDNGYWIPEGNDPLRILRDKRALPFHPHWALDAIKCIPSRIERQNKIAPNEGETEIAWFDHGAAPGAAHYEYAMVVDTTPEKMAAFAAAAPYRVLRRDATAHIVREASSGETGYALFEAGKVTEGPVQSVSKPCMIMTRPNGIDRLRVSFSDPDVGLYHKTTTDWVIQWFDSCDIVAGTRTLVTFAGAWTVEGKGAQVIDGAPVGCTMVEFHCVESQPVIVELHAAT